MDDFIIFPKKGRMILLAFLSFLFVLIGGIFVISYVVQEDIPIYLVIIGVISIVFFGFCMIYYMKEIIKTKPVLIISDAGIIDRSSYLAPGLVKWEDIKYIDFVEFGGQVFLGIYTHDPNLIIDQSTHLRKLLNKMNKGLLNSQVNIPVKNLSCTEQELVVTIEKYWQSENEA